VDIGKPHFLAKGVIAPDLVDSDLIVLTQLARDIDHGSRNVKVKGRLQPGSSP